METNSKGLLCCQRCWTPVKLDISFSTSLDEHTIAELSLPAVRTPELDYASQASSLDTFVTSQPDNISSNQEFTVVGHAVICNTYTPVGHLSHYIKQSTKLFDLASSTSDIDHPLCEDCADSLLDLLEQQLTQAEEECLEYKHFLTKITKETEDETLCSLDILEKELSALQIEDLELKTELRELLQKHELIINEIEIEKEEEKVIKQEEDSYWKSFSVHRNQQFQALDEQISLECQLRFTKSNLDRLKQTNAFNAAFHLWHTGHFGTINGLRMGRLPSVPVDWAEINAAWGQVTVLLSALARKVNLIFHRYKLLPFGSQSCIEDLIENKIYPLYGSGGFRFLWDAKFDCGMVSFLECLQQFQLKVEGTRKSEEESGRLYFQFPYR